MAFLISMQVFFFTFLFHIPLQFLHKFCWFFFNIFAWTEMKVFKWISIFFFFVFFFVFFFHKFILNSSRIYAKNLVKKRKSNQGWWQYFYNVLVYIAKNKNKENEMTWYENMLRDQTINNKEKSKKLENLCSIYAAALYENRKIWFKNNFQICFYRLEDNAFALWL